MGKVVFFPIAKVDLDRVRLTNEEVLILPVVWFEREDGSQGGGKRGGGRTVKESPEANAPTDCN